MADCYYFDYGHLMRDMRFFESHMAGSYREVLSARTEGQLLYLPEAHSPAMIPCDEGMVLGDLYRVDDSIFKNLDHLYGFQPGKPEKSHFVRRRVEVLLENDSISGVWVYQIRAEYLRKNFPNSHPIEDGDWKSFLESLNAQRRQDGSDGFPIQ